jgi:sortase A
MDRAARSTIWRRSEYCLWSVGFLILGYCTFIWLEAKRYQVQGNRELDIRFTEPRDKPQARPLDHGQLPYSYGSLVGRLEIPRLNLSVIAFEGTDGPVLERGAGHLIGSALPGDTGNSVFAAHRDTFFRELRNIRKDDVITTVTSKGSRRYRVNSIDIVDPTETRVLDPTPEPVLTLVTCYPFYYVGNAPRRFIVRAREVALTTESEPRPKAQAQPRQAATVASAARPVIRKQLRPVPQPTPTANRNRKRLNPGSAIKRLFSKSQKPS